MHNTALLLLSFMYDNWGKHMKHFHVVCDYTQVKKYSLVCVENII